MIRVLATADKDNNTVEQMKDDVIPINTSRGSNVDEDACWWRRSRVRSGPPVWTFISRSPHPTTIFTRIPRVGQEVLDVIAQFFA